MTIQSVFFVLLVVGGTALLSWPLGRYMAWVMDPADAKSGFSGLQTRAFHLVAGGAAGQSQDWKRYLLAMLIFNVVIFTVAFSILAFQHLLPLNPDGKGELDASLILNTAISFTTNTNLQHYSGEVAMSYLSQLAALMWLQFVTPAVGLAMLVALARGLAGRGMGNFFLDLQRATFLVLVPVALVFAILLVLGGVPMTFGGAVVATTPEGAEQTIARGPVAAFVAIKQLGTNGGGWFGPNSTHPLENPSFWTNIVQLVAIILIPMACVWMFGGIIGRMRHAAVLFGVMLVFLLTLAAGALHFESTPTQAFAELAIEQNVGNLEGKELRFDSMGGPVWSVITTSTSNGSVGSMHDSLNPLTGLMPMIGMWLNETFGGIGVGMINMFLYITLGVFIAGMMIGRTPEYLGWRVEAREVKLVLFALLCHGVLILGGTALFAATPWGADTLNNTGPHGFSEILYEFTSSAANNGSGFEGLGDGTPPWNIATGLVMLIARYVPIILPLAVVGSLISKRRSTESSGTLSVEGGTFATMLAATVIVIGALTFFPVATLGPVAEHLMHTN